MVPKHEQKRLAAYEVARAPNRMTIAFRRRLLHECYAAGDVLQPARLQQRPILALELPHFVGGLRPEMRLDLRAVMRVYNQADLFNTGVQRLLDNQLNGW